MTKRIKSGLITLVSLFAAVITTPQWADFVHFSNEKLASWGLPVAIIGLITVIISEVWKQILNARMIAESQKLGRGTATLDLY
jgi:hypothetical protein